MNARTGTTPTTSLTDAPDLRRFAAAWAMILVTAIIIGLIQRLV